MNSMNAKRCGYVALLGQPNAGKSTLMNACLGTKLAVVSAKPQTTRNKILGICPVEETQILFLDTPGVHNTSGMPKLNQKMTAAAWSVLADANVVCYLVDSVAGWTEDDSLFFGQLIGKTSVPVIVVATKGDKAKSEIIQTKIDQIDAKVSECLNQARQISTVEQKEVPEGEASRRLLTGNAFSVSAKRPEEVIKFRTLLARQMPESPWLFPEDDLTDRPQNFVCGELIREQLFRQLGQELPYSAAVKVDKLQFKTNLIHIMASVIVHKENHKAMVIGARGSRIKSIGQAARESLEKHFAKQVHLELFVKVQPNWIDSDALLAEYAGLERMEE